MGFGQGRQPNSWSSTDVVFYATSGIYNIWQLKCCRYKGETAVYIFTGRHEWL